MEFIALHCSKKLKIINPLGTIGLITLWSPIEPLHKLLASEGVDLSPTSSPIAVIGNFRGNGFKELLRNLLFNPQLDTLLVVGSDLSGSFEYLETFFKNGLDPVLHTIKYLPIDAFSPQAVRVSGTNLVIDNLVKPSSFQRAPSLVRFKTVGAQLAVELKAYLQHYQPDPQTLAYERIEVPIPTVKITDYPNNPRNHFLVADSPSEAWQALAHRVYRYGKTVQLKKGERRELQNVKVVIEHPVFEDNDTLKACGFNPDDLKMYQTTILSPHNRDNFTYTYGSRIREYFGFDTLDKVINNFRDELDNRGSYISLWDTRGDMIKGSQPCLVSIFFRKIDDVIFMTATFRTHNLATAWLTNVYGLMAIQQHVAKATNLNIGAITVISLSISISPDSYDKMQLVHDSFASKPQIFRPDPVGYFVITVDNREIIVHHHAQDGYLMDEYRAENPIQLQNQLIRKIATLELSHAIYLGRQLEKAYHCIKDGHPFNQDN